MIRTCPLFLLAALAALPLAAAPGDSASTPFYTDSTFNGKLETTARRLPSPGTPRDSNNNDTAGYMDTQVQTQLRLDLGDKVDSVHFIRDNNDPLVVTKTYVLKHAEPYALRTYLREMVQTRRVSGSNTAVECLKFEDGVGLLFVSAEEYRFKDSENGMGIDAIVERLDTRRRSSRKSTTASRTTCRPLPASCACRCGARRATKRGMSSTRA